jgi:cytidylate kinase
MLAFTRQIILLIPISLLLGVVLKKGIYGVLYAGLVSDILCFIMAIFVFKSEYNILSKEPVTSNVKDSFVTGNYKGKHIVITIAREYGSGGHFVGKLLAEKLGIGFYDKELISLTAKKTGLSKEYIENKEEKKQYISYADNNDDRIFIAEKKVIEDLAKNESCVIVGRCADYVLKDNKDTIKVFLYSDIENKIARAVKYYGIDKLKAKKIIGKENKERAKHYKYYTQRDWICPENYDIMLNVDKYGVDKVVDCLITIINEK